MSLGTPGQTVTSELPKSMQLPTKVMLLAKQTTFATNVSVHHLY
jgi:hypothetical protein